MKLMSRHLIVHLFVPLLAGVGFEILIAWVVAWYRGLPISLDQYLISPERFGLYGGFVVTYLIIAGWFVYKEAKPPWRKAVTQKLDDSLKDAASFFATCTIPL